MINYIFKTKVDNHQEIKEELLQKINLIPQNPMTVKDSKILHTDWHLPRDMYREYKDLFLKTVDPHMKYVGEKLEVDSYEIVNYWFQIYGQGNTHTWHNHPGLHYAHVYFIECPKGLSTKFKNFEVDCEEGDILSFPAFIPHMSPLIKNNEMKTIIAFNSNFIL